MSSEYALVQFLFDEEHPVHDKCDIEYVKKTYVWVSDLGGQAWLQICRTAKLERRVYEIFYSFRRSGVLHRIRLVVRVWLQQFSDEITTHFIVFCEHIEQGRFGMEIGVGGAVQPFQRRGYPSFERQTS